MESDIIAVFGELNLTLMTADLTGVLKMSIDWNRDLKLIISDVDDTIAKASYNIDLTLRDELEEILDKGIFIFLISGQSITNILDRVIRFINPKYLKNMFIGHCNGAEVFQFDEQGHLVKTPIFSILNLRNINISHKEFENVIYEIMKKFNLSPFPALSIEEFKRKTKNNPRHIMYDDRDIQISLDFVNSLDPMDFNLQDKDYLYSESHDDIRHYICKKANEIISKKNLPISPHLAGVCAIDFTYCGVNKGLPVSQIVKVGDQPQNISTNEIYVHYANEIEIWGDSFSIDTGSDYDLCVSLPRTVRAISFRDLDARSKTNEYNIVEWNGRYRCENGLLEFLKSRKTSSNP